MTQSAFDGIWKDALNKYESEAQIKLSLTIQTPDDLLALIDKENQQFEAYRKKGLAIRNAVEPVLCLVRLFSNAAGQGVSLVSDLSLTACLLYTNLLRAGAN